jgi:predicted tellurium resistance membrane protein TerC
MKVSTLKTMAIVLGLLLSMHAISMIVNNKQNSKKGYQSQNLILSVFYLMFAIALVGGAVSTRGPSSPSGEYYPM